MGSMSMMKTLSILYLFALLLCVNGARISIQNARTSASSSTPPPVENPCSDSENVLMPCVNYFMLGSNQTIPTPSCCKGFKRTLSVNATCICVGLKDAHDLLGGVNFTRALTVPELCGIAIKNLPPAAQCNVTEINRPNPPPGASVPSPAPPIPPATPPPAAATPIKPTPATPPPSTPATPAPSTPSAPIVPTVAPTSNSSATATAPAPSSSPRTTGPLFLISAIMVVGSFLSVV